MPRPRKWPPTYRRHPKGQAYIRVEGRNIYLGRHGTAESLAKYRQVTAEIEASGAALHAAAKYGLTVNHLVLSYLQAVKIGDKQLPRVRAATKALCRSHGSASAVQFGPVALEAVRHQMVQADWSRSYINSCIGVIKTIWKWAVSRELLPADRWQALRSLPGLRLGAAKEPPKVRPVPEADALAVLPHVLPPVAAMIQLQLLTAMRSGELVIMRGCDLNTQGEIWTYRPDSHKTAHLGHDRIIYLGPQAQAVLKPWLCLDTQAFLFSPRRAVEQWLEANDRKVRFKRRRAPGERYRIDSYGHAIAAGCRKAGVPHWSPHQLRHLSATRIRASCGLDVARACLGHRTASITENYAERDRGAQQEAMRRLG